MSALHQLNVLDTLPEEAFDRITELAARVFRTPVALVSLVDADRQWFKSCRGIRMPETPREVSFCQYTLGGDLFVVPDAHTDARFNDNPLVTGEPFIRFYAGAPLVLPSGLVAGSLCVIDHEPRADLTPDERAVLQGLADIVADALGARQELQERVALEEEFRHIVEQSSDVVFRLDAEHRVTFMNAAGYASTGFTPEEILGMDGTLYIAGSPEEQANALLLMAELAEGRSTYVRHETQYRAPDGSSRWVDVQLRGTFDAQGRYTGALGLAMDVTERKNTERHLLEARNELERRVAERTQELSVLNEQLQHDALHDALTGLPNRAFFYERLSLAIERYQENPQQQFAVLFLDCDRFKSINDTLGHSAGDELLIGFAQRLQGLVRPDDTVARLGGDEFIVLLESLDDFVTAERVAERVLRALNAPFLLSGTSVHVGASIGIVTSEGAYDHPDGVMRDADIAMYRVKSSGRGGFVHFRIDMREDAVATMQLEQELRGAIEKNELAVYYQPIIELERGTLAGFEALVRWPHATQGMLSPATFIPLAEDTGLIIELDRWVLFEACRQMTAWTEEHGVQHLSLSVNLSAQQFVRADLLETVQIILHATSFPPERLKLEITESLVMERSEQVARNIDGLRGLGVRLEIDDFGTGYSSLSYLQRFAASTLKIDRSFVNTLLEQKTQEELVRTIITLAHNFGMSVTAEGVETPDQLHRLRDLGCECAQGFLFSKPVSAAQAVGFLQALSLTEQHENAS